MHRILKSTSNQLRLGTFVILMQLVAAGVLDTEFDSTFSNRMSQQLGSTLNHLADRVEDQVQRFLAPAENAVKIGADMIAGGVIDGFDDRELERYFLSQMLAVPWINGIYVGRPDGSFVYVTRNEYGLRTKIISLKDGQRKVSIIQRGKDGEKQESWLDPNDTYDPRTRIWYERASHSGTLIRTDPYTFFSSRMPGITVASLAAHAGVIGVDIDILELSAFVSNIPFLESSTATIIDKFNNAIAFSDKTKYKINSEDATIPIFDQIAGQPLKTLHGVAVANKITELSRPSNEIRFFTNNVEHIGIIRPLIFTKRQSDWLLLIQVRADLPTNNILGFIKKGSNIAAVITLLIGQFVLFGILYSVYKTKPEVSDTTENKNDFTDDIILFKKALSNIANADVDSERTKSVAVIVLAIDPQVSEYSTASPTLDSVGNDYDPVKLAEHLTGKLNDSDLIVYTPDHQVIVGIFDNFGNDESTVNRLRAIHEMVQHFPLSSEANESGISSGAALHEPGEPVSNLIKRAQDALEHGQCTARSTCHFASGLDGTQPCTRKAA